MKTCNTSNNIFQEAINHCRWKAVLYSVLKKINISEYNNNNTFEEIILQIYIICNNVKGIGLLTIYDITAAICRYYKINIDKVYIIGNGPKRAIKLLNIKTKICKINDNIKLRYVDICDIINAFDLNSYDLDINIRNNKNGDILETYICNWQKTK
jgi:hypothetical protein